MYKVGWRTAAGLERLGDHGGHFGFMRFGGIVIEFRNEMGFTANGPNLRFAATVKGPAEFKTLTVIALYLRPFDNRRNGHKYNETVTQEISTRVER